MGCDHVRMVDQNSEKRILNDEKANKNTNNQKFQVPYIFSMYRKKND